MGYSMTNQLSTMGLEEKYNTYKLSDGSTIGCTIFDTNGTDRYRFLNETYYKKIDGCLIVYDITNRRSFDEIEKYYIPKLKEKCKKNIATVLLGNKKDMEDKRKVSLEEGDDLAKKYNFIFKEASCFENINVFDVFQTIIENTFYEKRKNSNNQDEDSISLSIDRHVKLNRRKTGCC